MVLTPQTDGPTAIPPVVSPAEIVLFDARAFRSDVLWPFLAMAAHEPDADAAKDIAYLQRFLSDWPRTGDFGFVAMQAGAPVAACWARRFGSAEAEDFFVDAATPELVIGVQPRQRGCGLGRALLDSLACEARTQGCAGLCLTVRDGNPAMELYARAGFETVARGRNRVGGISLGMVLKLETREARN